jgi:aspartate ammonia-lyase
MNTRREHDLLGEREVPNDRYYGIQTMRALENYQITGIQISHYPILIRAPAYNKKAVEPTTATLYLHVISVPKAKKKKAKKKHK